MTPEDGIELLRRPTISPRKLYESGIYPSGLAGIYRDVHEGRLDHIRLGKNIAIITASLRKKLGIADAA